MGGRYASVYSASTFHWVGQKQKAGKAESAGLISHITGPRKTPKHETVNETKRFD